MKYAVEPTEVQVAIVIRIEAVGGSLRLQVKDESEQAAVVRLGEHGAGIGLRNVRERLAAGYGGKADLHVSRTPFGFLATVELPLTVTTEAARMQGAHG